MVPIGCSAGAVLERRRTLTSLASFVLVQEEDVPDIQVHVTPAGYLVEGEGEAAAQRKFIHNRRERLSPAQPRPYPVAQRAIQQHSH